MSLKEDSIPVDKTGRPDLSKYTDSAEYYAEMYGKFIAAMHGKWSWIEQTSNLPYRCRVHATWGLIAKGPEAVPYALQMLQSPEPEAREDGAGILASVGKDATVVETLVARLAAETDITARDAIIATLGAMRNQAAIIRDAAVDGDTRWTAVESLGKIVRRRFLKQEKPIEAAIDWLEKHEK